MTYAGAPPRWAYADPAPSPDEQADALAKQGAETAARRRRRRLAADGEAKPAADGQQSDGKTQPAGVKVQAAAKRTAKKQPAGSQPAKKGPAKKQSAKKGAAKKQPANKGAAKKQPAKKQPAKRQPGGGKGKAKLDPSLAWTTSDPPFQVRHVYSAIRSHSTDHFGGYHTHNSARPSSGSGTSVKLPNGLWNKAGQMFVAGQKGLPARLSWPCTSVSSQLPAITSTPPAACADQPAQRGLMSGRRGWHGRLQAREQAPGCARLTADACCPQERGANSAPGMEERSYYIDYIYKDLEPWKENGITEVRGCRVKGWNGSSPTLSLH